MVYPRACGGTEWGLLACNEAFFGSIPAHAGEPGVFPHPVRRQWVYPRACGGTRGRVPPGPLDKGLSPRMRGNRAIVGQGIILAGSIPAHAGEPQHPSRPRSRSRVYPRACGGTVGAHLVSARRRGSIPAHAGEPSTPSAAPTIHAGLSPRMRGNLMMWTTIPACRRGLSPLMRGNPTRALVAGGRVGSIPAHASGTCDLGEARLLSAAGLSPRMRGNQLTVSQAPAESRVYPRACGGTGSEPRRLVTGRGLSPRMRGNRDTATRSPYTRGSIPAHAGEPCRPAPSAVTCRVYPRACGGTPCPWFAVWSSWGLSPRMRGNPKNTATQG